MFHVLKRSTPKPRGKGGNVGKKAVAKRRKERPAYSAMFEALTRSPKRVRKPGKVVPGTGGYGRRPGKPVPPHRVPQTSKPKPIREHYYPKKIGRPKMPGLLRKTPSAEEAHLRAAMSRAKRAYETTGDVKYRKRWHAVRDELLSRGYTIGRYPK